MTIKLSPLVHIECVVPNAEKAYQFLNDAFGAEKVQEEFAGFLDGENARVIHVGLGDIVLQFIQPITEEGSWYEQLRDKGPGVHNLTFILDDMKDAVKTMETAGIVPKFFFPLDWASWLGADMVKEDPQPVYMMDCMKSLGFHLELAESPMRDAPPVSEAAPALEEKFGRVTPMLHIELTTDDAEATYQLLKTVFGSEKVELEFAGFLDSEFMKIVHVNLSDVVLQYCQPLIQEGSWYEQLRDKGPGVHNITFVVENMEQTMNAINKAGAEDLFAFPLDWGLVLGAENAKENIPPVHMVNTMDLLGFHLELGERPADDLGDFLFKEI